MEKQIDNYKDFDKLSLYVKKYKAEEIIKHYKNFNWKLVSESENKKYEDIVDLTFIRKHKIENSILDRVNYPEDIRKLNIDEKKQLCSELREYIINYVINPIITKNLIDDNTKILINTEESDSTERKNIIEYISEKNNEINENDSLFFLKLFSKTFINFFSSWAFIIMFIMDKLCMCPTLSEFNNGFIKCWNFTLFFRFIIKFMLISSPKIHRSCSNLYFTIYLFFITSYISYIYIFTIPSNPCIRYTCN